MNRPAHVTGASIGRNNCHVWCEEFPADDGAGYADKDDVAYDSRVHHRRSHRVRGWDYAAPGAYFVTVCANDRSVRFGELRDATMHLNELGNAIAETWRWLPSRYPHVVLDEWSVMPDHLHGILILTGRGGSRTAPTSVREGIDPRGDVTTMKSGVPSKPIGRLIGAFKTVSTKRVNELRQTPGAVLWQRDFWDRIIRNDAEMDALRSYIRNNPVNWTINHM